MIRRLNFYNLRFFCEFYNIIHPISIYFSNFRTHDDSRLVERGSTNHLFVSRGALAAKGRTHCGRALRTRRKGGFVSGMEAQFRNATMFTRLCYPYSPYSRGRLHSRKLVKVSSGRRRQRSRRWHRRISPRLYPLPPTREEYPDTPATKHRNTVIIEEMKVAFAVGKKCRRATRVLPSL